MTSSIARIEKIYDNTYVIREVGCAGEVNMYLLTGSSRALLIDCGYGAADLPSLIATVTNLPVTVVCTHGHVDHALGSWMFENVYLHPADKNILFHYPGHGRKPMKCSSIKKLIRCCTKGVQKGDKARKTVRLGRNVYVAKYGLFTAVLYK